ncbi:histidine kinase [Hymenobacter roseosalivarius DSM 11622]|uniref:histidine kinase n=1 Tax=Hymenobacter roseosalivarius DSM 11622 TaxID=645990 RepID=A0A1W1W531_9BACT|nr:ATP-binding protein [Hymenobacter roseosalivarius]SMC00643.1 histidine kinase [Hymenobacter roseosalivarius DSM 11622]
MRSILLLVACGLLFLSTLTAAQLPEDPAALQSKPRPGYGTGAAQTTAQAAARYRYWEAPPDSLRRVLTEQRADTARLRTLLHLLDLQLENVNPKEAAALATRLGRPEARALRLLPTAQGSDPKLLVAQLDSMKAAITAFDQLGRPVPRLLSALLPSYAALNQQEAMRTYYQTKRRYYQARGATENVAACLYNLSRYYVYKGDYNQSISHYLRAAELYRGFDRFSYYNRLMGVGARYAEWGNPAKALPYLQQALRAPRRWGLRTYIYHTIARLWLQQHDYPAALQAVEQALRLPAGETNFGVSRPHEKPQGLILKSAVLLALGRTAEAGPLLYQAQRQADSLHLPLTGPGGNLELDATWARYYAARGEVSRAETAWLEAYHKARANGNATLRLKYLRELAGFYQAQHQPAPAARYALAATALADTMETAQGALHVASYEFEQADRVQQARIARLRESQLLATAQARRQRLLLGATLAGSALLAGLGYVLWRSNQQKQRANEQLEQQQAALRAQRDETARALAELRMTQAQLIQKEKMASLGELTAGIAHEIQNPLNFVTNFSDVSAELMLELQEAQLAGDGEEVTVLAGDVIQNLTKIRQHGQRASSIVRGMLEHARPSTGERQPTDVNALCEEYLRLAYQGQRTKDSLFEVEITTNFAPGLAPVHLVAADVGHVLLNLYANAFYALHQRRQQGEPGYEPTLQVTTEHLGEQVEIRVQDNGGGMADDVQAKIFQPFFTTKPAGEGTGLGLSLSYDIIAQGHGGTLQVESQEGEGSQFVLSLPA